MAGNAFGPGTPFAYVASPQTPWGLQYSAPQQLVPLLLHSLQTVPQQLQQMQQLEYLQQQQIQQLLQVIPAQLAQVQQLIQYVLQQIQQGQQPFNQAAGSGTYAVAPPWSVTPGFFGTQPAQIM